MSENVGFAGQIGPEHVDQVVEKGFKSIINNRNFPARMNFSNVDFQIKF